MITIILQKGRKFVREQITDKKIGSGEPICYFLLRGITTLSSLGC